MPSDALPASPGPAGAPTQRPDQRLAHRYHFDDPDMDLFFMAALSWGPAGGLDIGQVWHIADGIRDGDADSWVEAFAAYGDRQQQLATQWSHRGWRRSAGEARLKAFASYRSAWQFAEAGGARFQQLYAQHQTAFATAMSELDLPATFFETPWQGGRLPGVFLRNARSNAPVILVIGGADTAMEDLFLSIGRGLWERGYSVAMVDLPGQGNTASQGLHWAVEAERPIAAVLDTLITTFGAVPGRIGLVGLSLGGYFVTRAAASETRLATVVASTPFPAPGKLFAQSVQAAQAASHPPSLAAQRSRRCMAWKAGVDSAEGLLARWLPAEADPTQVQLPFLSVLGAGDSPVFAAQARQWHEQIRSTRKDFVFLDAESGADGHCQVNARVRLVQETAGWLGEIFAA